MTWFDTFLWVFIGVAIPTGAGMLGVSWSLWKRSGTYE
jgi:hypothetical protein